MAVQPRDAGTRLDSWKAIADYLGRDLATVRRWEKNLDLPVRRVSGNGRSVFAYTADIDEWLTQGTTATRVDPPIREKTAVRRWPLSAAAFVIVVVAVAIGSLALRARPLSASDLKVTVTTDAITAADSSGRVRWQRPFPVDYKIGLPGLSAAAQIATGADPSVLVATAQRARRSDEAIEGGTVQAFGLDGTPGRSFSFDDQFALGDSTYGPPWCITAFGVNSEDHQRIAVAAHHYYWEASLVTVLDLNWRRIGTFHHAGWVESVSWLSANRLLLGGFSNPHDGGMVALLDPAALNGQGPEAPGSAGYCVTCGPDRPVRMAIFPRSEVNRASGSPFNRVIVQLAAGRIVARTIEVPQAPPAGAADALYEFTPELELTRATFSDRYWEVHRALEAEGKITHSRENCPDRNGPREFLQWTPSAGWQTVSIKR